RPPRRPPTMALIDEAGSQAFDLGLAGHEPRVMEYVADLLKTSDSVVAVVAELSVATSDSWTVELSRIHVLRDGQWRPVGNAYVQATAVWQGRAIFAIPSISGIDWYELVGEDLVVRGGTEVFNTPVE